MKVESVEVFEVENYVDVFDIGVQDNHNYFVYPPIGSTPVLAHNCHKANSTCFSKVVSAFPTRVKFGSTGTPERKDGKEKIMRDILGPVVARSTVESMNPIVKTVWTDLRPRNSYKQWTFAMKWIANNEDRNQLIIDHVLQDLQRGHSIIIPCVFRNHIAELTRRINAEYGSRIADYFVGGGDKKNLARRELVLEEAKSGKVRVVVGTRSILQLGLNVPRWSMIYEIMPISNKPNLKQETSRVRTPMEGKKTPEIKFFVDELSQSMYCFKASIHHCQQFGYTLDRSVYDVMALVSANLGFKNWLAGSSRATIKKGGIVERKNGKLF